MADSIAVAMPTGIAAVDTANINAAISALPTAGGRLVFQSGIYLVNSTITLPPQGLIEGSAPAVLPETFATPGTVIRFVSPFAWSNGRMIDALLANDLELRNVIFELSGTTITDPGVANACCLAVANYVQLRNVLVRNIQSAGANTIWGLRQFGGGSWVSASNLSIVLCDGGARFDNAQNVLWSQCSVGNSLRNPNLQIAQTPTTGLSTVTFEQCVIDETAFFASALVQTPCQDVTFTDCIFYGGIAAALDDQGTRTKLVNCKLLPWNNNAGMAPYMCEGASGSLLQNCFLRSSANMPVVSLSSNGTATFTNCTIAPGPGGSVVTGTGTAIFRNCPGINPRGDLGVATPAVPASNVALTNNTGFDVTVYLNGGTVTAVAIGGTATGLTSGSFRLVAGQTITLTYTVAPTWRWQGD